MVLKLDTMIVDSLNVIKTKTPPRYYEVAPRHHHSLSYRIVGENLLCEGDTEITSNVRTLTFVPIGKQYTHRIITPSEQIVAHFTTKGDIGDSILNFKLPLHCDIENLFFDLYNQWEQKPTENNIHCMSVFYNIMALIADSLTMKDKPKHKLIADSVAYMHAHYRESDFNITRLYEQAYISPAYYRRIFHEVYKCSPIEYLKNLRMNYAKQLLRNGYYTVEEISELSGFSNSTYFSYEFKRMTGYTPSQYRG